MAYTSDAEGQLLRQVVLARGGSQPVLDAVNHFYQFGIPKILSSYNIRTSEGLIGKFINPILNKPYFNGQPLYPYQARRDELSYMAQLSATFEFYQVVGDQLIPVPGQQLANVVLGKVPVILQSILCHLYGLTQEQMYLHGEPEKDPGAYAIIKGQEKVLLNIENLRSSEAFLYEDKGEFNVRYTSQSLTQTSINIVKDYKDNIHVTFDAIGTDNSINVFSIFYILGLQEGTVEKALNEIDNFILDDDPVKQKRRRKEMRYYMQLTKFNFEKLGADAKTIYDRVLDKVRDKTIKIDSKKYDIIRNLVWSQLFSNIPLVYKNQDELISILRSKIRLLASMIAKYVDFKNGYRTPDDRDSWSNKQLADSAKHLARKFNKIWESIIAEIDKIKVKNIAGVRKALKVNFMSEQFIQAYTKNMFTIGKGRKQRDITIVDTLDRDNILAAIAHVRRISTPTNRRAKIREKRLIHNTQWGAVCPVFTQEGEGCILETTPVLLANGNEIQVKDLRNGDEVLTIDPVTLQQSSSKIHSHFIKSTQEYGKTVLKIATLNGREIICTDDHPFYTQNGWIYARDLNPQVHVLAIYPGVKTLPHVVLENKLILNEEIYTRKLQVLGVKTSLISKHIQKLNEKKLLPLYNNDLRLPIISRLVGFTLADGSLGLSKEGKAYSSHFFGTQYDGQLFIEDMKRIGFHENELRYRETTVIDKITGRETTHHTWIVSYGGCFATLMLALDLMYGKRIEKVHNPIPQWILDSSLAVKREFVAGFQGGDGGRMFWSKRHDKVKAGKYNFGETVQHKTPEHLESLITFMQQIANICIELGVEIMGVRTSIASETRHMVRIDFSDKEENIMKYMEMIGYRYATSKSTASYHISEYLKYKHNKIQERIDLKAKVVNLVSQGVKRAQIAVQLGVDFKQVTSILSYKGNGGTLAPKDTIGYEQWLGCTAAKNNCVFMPIAKIEPHEHCMIADFTTESENHSMISNSFVTHNCGLTKDSAITTYISLDRDESLIFDYLNGVQIIKRATIIPYEGNFIVQQGDSFFAGISGMVQTERGVEYPGQPAYSIIPNEGNKYPLYINGIPIGFCDSTALRNGLLQLRRSEAIYFDTGIILNIQKELKIFTNSGRVCRPLLIVDHDTQELLIDIKRLRGSSLEEILSQGAIEYVDVAEQEQVQILIAEDVRHLQMSRDSIITASQQYQRLLTSRTQDGVLEATQKQIDGALTALQNLQNRMKYTHCEIDPTVILGISAISMPFPEFNQGPRVTYQCLHPNTLIRMADGSDRMIRDVQIDDEVMTFDPENDNVTITKVVNQYVRFTNKDIVRVRTFSGKEIVCTDDHMFMTDQGWTPAKELVNKNVLHNMKYIPVEYVTPAPEMGNMIADITTESENHSFIAAGFGVHNSGMVKQSLGGNSSRIELRFDTSMKTILEPGVPTVSTDAHEFLGLDQYPSGRELIIAITTYGGSNQEDAITFNKAAVDLGLFLMMIYHSYQTTICQSRNARREFIRIPDYPPNQASRYSKLDPATGMVRLGETVSTGDCLVGKVIIDANGIVTNDSLYVERGKEGVIDEIYNTINAENCNLVRIRIRELRKLQVGDKLASRYAQKGTIGAILPEKDMPWIVSEQEALNGIKPHVIFNPHGIPSRMTMGKLFEFTVGKVTAMTGERFNATAFRRFGQPVKEGEPPRDNLDAFKDQLAEYGFSRSGKEKMVNGITGREMDAEIFIGTSYYQLLRHLVQDKMQARGTGSVQFLTRQPTSGIRREGGLRSIRPMYMNKPCASLHCRRRYDQNRGNSCEVSDTKSIRKLIGGTGERNSDEKVQIQKIETIPRQTPKPVMIGHGGAVTRRRS
jgi:DNA-directed RNA polymerase beta subunit